MTVTRRLRPILRIGQRVNVKREFTLYEDDGGATENTYDLTDAENVTVTFEHYTGAFNMVTNGQCEIVDPEAGVVEYHFTVADTTTLFGEYAVQFEVTKADGSVELVPPDGYEWSIVVGRRQPGDQHLEVQSLSIGEGGLRGLSIDPLHWLAGGGLSNVNGRLTVTASMGIEGLSNPLTSNLNADQYLIKNLGSPVDPNDHARKAETDANETAIDANTQAVTRNTTDISANTTSIGTLETEKASRAGDTLDPAILNNARIVAPSIPGAFDTFKAAYMDLPPEGGKIYVAESCTETGDITVDRTIILVGQGSNWAVANIPYIDLNGHSIHFTTTGATIDKVKFRNPGGFILGEHGSNLGRHDIDTTLHFPSGDGVEFRGGHMESNYSISVQSPGGNGFVWNLDTDSASDYFNDNYCDFTVSGAGQNAYVMTGIGTATADIHGNEFRNMRAEQTTGTAWTVDSKIDLKANFMSGFGLHDSGVNVQPAVADANTIDFGRLKGGGTLHIGGPVRVPRTRRDALSLGPNTAFWDQSNAGGLTKSSLNNFTTHAGSGVLVGGNAWQTIFNKANGATVECGTITGHNVGSVRATWTDGTTSLIYRNQARGADNVGNYQSVKALPRIQNVKVLEFQNAAGSAYEYGWDVTTATY